MAHSAEIWRRKATIRSLPRRGSAISVIMGIFLVLGVQVASAAQVDAGIPRAPSGVLAHSTSAPSPRGGASMAYDPATGATVLFGGSSTNDTWTWNGSTWTRQFPATSPEARTDASMAYDASIGKIVLFGGEGFSASGPPLLDDTWIWSGTDWIQQSPTISPPARSGASMAYDATTGTLVLFGGISMTTMDRYATDNDTWTFDGSTWTLEEPASVPTARFGASMAYDASTGNVLLFGGFEVTPSSDTWIWNGTTWAELAPASSPPPRFDASMAYDTSNGTIVLFGGLGPDAAPSPRAQWPRRHLDLGRDNLDPAVSGHRPAGDFRRIDGLRPVVRHGRPLRWLPRATRARTQRHLDLGRVQLGLSCSPVRVSPGRGGRRGLHLRHGGIPGVGWRGPPERAHRRYGQHP